MANDDKNIHTVKRREIEIERPKRVWQDKQTAMTTTEKKKQKTKLVTNGFMLSDSACYFFSLFSTPLQCVRFANA